MKKLLVVAVAALVTTSAFAQKHMVRMYGWDSGSRNSSFDFSMSSDDQDAAEESNRYNINYAYAINGQFQVGITYDSKQSSTDGDVEAGSYTKTGLSGYYNIHGQVKDTCYVGLHYNMTNYADDVTGSSSQDSDTNTDIVLEYGHRFAVGNAWGFDLTFAPAVMYSMSTYSPDADGADDVNTNALAWNFLKFDVLF